MPLLLFLQKNHKTPSCLIRVTINKLKTVTCLNINIEYLPILFYHGASNIMPFCLTANHCILLHRYNVSVLLASCKEKRDYFLWNEKKHHHRENINHQITNCSIYSDAQNTQEEDKVREQNRCPVFLQHLITSI